MHYFGFFGLLLLSSVLLSSCRTAVTSITRADHADSIVSVRYIERIVKDTITLHVPAESVSSVATSDTSEVHTSLASSRAWLDPAGTLHHTIENLPNTLPVVIDRVEVVKDSVLYRDRYHSVATDFKRKAISPWTCFCAGFILCLFLLGALCLSFRR